MRTYIRTQNLLDKRKHKQAYIKHLIQSEASQGHIHTYIHTYMHTYIRTQNLLDKRKEKHPYIKHLIQSEVSKGHFTCIIVSDIKPVHVQGLSPSTGEKDKYQTTLEPCEICVYIYEHTCLCVYMYSFASSAENIIENDE